jgi:hypothetical protein
MRPPFGPWNQTDNALRGDSERRFASPCPEILTHLVIEYFWIASHRYQGAFRGSVRAVSFYLFCKELGFRYIISPLQTVNHGESKLQLP